MSNFIITAFAAIGIAATIVGAIIGGFAAWDALTAAPRRRCPHGWGPGDGCAACAFDEATP